MLHIFCAAWCCEIRVKALNFEVLEVTAGRAQLHRKFGVMDVDRELHVSKQNQQRSVTGSVEVCVSLQNWSAARIGKQSWVTEYTTASLTPVEVAHAGGRDVSSDQTHLSHRGAGMLHGLLFASSALPRALKAHYPIPLLKQSLSILQVCFSKYYF